MHRVTLFALLLFFNAPLPACAEQTVQHYKAGSQISAAVAVQDKSGREYGLIERIAASGQELNIVYIFGGGGMGNPHTDATGGLWCPDSFEDLHIFRSLARHYDGELGFFAVAVPPVFHTRDLGFSERVLLDARREDEAYRTARTAFIESTEQALARGTIPVAPLYDIDFNFLISEAQSRSRQSIHPKQSWHGAFRAENETQSYGVPNLWLVDGQGKVVAEPFRGNVYRAHGGNIVINYTLSDVIAAIEAHKAP